MPITEKDRIRGLYEKEAPKYDRSMGFWDRALFAGTREWACSHADGDVLEVAVGTGRNLAHYGGDVHLTGIEFSPAMLEIAKSRAEELGIQADLRLGDAEQLDFPDASFDTVLCTFALCTIPDDGQAVREMHRVLRPAGKLVLVEHVRSPNPVVRGAQRALEPLTLRFEGDHLLREPLEHVRSAGFAVEELVRSKLGIVERLLAAKPA